MSSLIVQLISLGGLLFGFVCLFVLFFGARKQRRNESGGRGALEGVERKL